MVPPFTVLMRGKLITISLSEVFFSQLPTVKKDTIFGAVKKIFGPSYFMTALVGICLCFETVADPSVQILDFCLYLFK